MKIETITISLLIMGVLLMGIYISYLQDNPMIETEFIEDNSSMLNVEIYQWAENIDDSSEMFFDYYIYNYGNTEAKNVKVECKLIEVVGSDYKVIRTVIDNFGNVASNKREFGEVVTSVPDNFNKEYTGYCYIKSCDDCKILHKNIPELIKIFEEDNFD